MVSAPDASRCNRRGVPQLRGPATILRAGAGPKCQECANKALSGYSTNSRESSGWFIRGIKIPSRDPATGLFGFLEAGSSCLALMSICNPGDFTTDQPGPAPAKALYDKFGRVVYYRVYYKRNLCTIYAHGGRFGSERVLEVKVAWRQLEPSEKDRYVHRVYNLPNIGPTLVGIVGVHVAIDATDHPGLIWATFEHKQNAADCEKPTNNSGWSFTSDACASCLQTSPLGECRQIGRACENINSGPVQANTAGPTQVCRLHPSGGADATNQTEIAKLNIALSGPNGLLTNLPAKDPMAVLGNYFHGGTLWLTPTLGDIADVNQLKQLQKGSLKLANTTLESFQQDQNCFSCHKPFGQIMTYPVSHILPHGQGPVRRP